jgi:deoxycytidine triphosphate deaminase
MITGEKLLDAVRNETFIKGGIPRCAEGVKYDFRLSGRILKASFHGPIDATKLTTIEQAKLAVEPGEMVFVLSEERLDLPSTVVAELSPKRKMSHAGVLAIGGFCIDPLYKGRLLIGLYNFSSTAFFLIPGKKVIAATFYELDESERSQFATPEAALEDFPEELVQVMQKYSPTSMASVSELIEKFRTELDSLRTEIRSRDEWYKRFQESLERHDKQIEGLLSGLEQEREARKAGEDKLTLELQGLHKTLAWLKGAAWGFWVLLGTLLGVLGSVGFSWLRTHLK